MNTSLLHFLLSTILSVLSISSFAASLQFTRNFVMPNPTVKEREDPDGRPFQEVIFDGYSYNEEYGFPALGWETINVEIPYNATDISVSISSFSVHTVTALDKTLWPCQKPLETSLNPKIGFTPIDTFAYTESSSLPSIRLIGNGLIAGKSHVATVAIRPFGYNFVKNEITSYSSVAFKIIYNTGINIPLTLTGQQRCNYPENCLLSNSITSGFEHSPHKAWSASTDTAGSIGSYYIIVPASLKDAVNKLALQWKRHY